MWSIYMDMELVQGDIQSLRYVKILRMELPQLTYTNLRNLFGRVLALNMTSHKAKYVISSCVLQRDSKCHVYNRSFFKKWLEAEKRIGDEEGVTAVKQKAMEWAQRALNAS